MWMALSHNWHGKYLKITEDNGQSQTYLCAGGGANRWVVEVNDGVTRGGGEKVRATKSGQKMRADESGAAQCYS